MSVLSTPLKNELASQKDIFRLAATIYSETSDVVSDAEAQLQIIKCMFVATGNEYFDKSEIIAKLLDIYKYHISEDEVGAVIKKSRGVFLSITKDDSIAYCLTPQVYADCIEAQKNNIDSFIDLFIAEHGIVDKESCKNAIHVYLYELTTTNINSYRILLAGKDGTQFTSNELSVDVSDLTDAEKQLVHDFLCWDNPSKNTALGNLVYCCLEYCLLINGDSPNKLLNGFIKHREIYLDTNMVFRALGINGASRKKVITAFLNKCKQAKLKLIISHATKKEFFDTIGYYVSQMEHYPSGNIFSGAYEQITDFNIFAFYEDWHQQHPQLPLKYFIIYIKSMYMDIVKDYGIDDDERIPAVIYHSDNFKDARNKYSASIKNIKQRIKESYLADDYSYTQRDSHDATVVRYIELLREKSKEKDVFLVSSDKALRLWDMNRHDVDYPVVIYPSQLFLILLKTCGRSEDDYDSFVSFINIRPFSKQISPENAHIILAGISSITEDIKVQKHLVAAVYDDDFQNVIKSSHSDADLYEKVQKISQNYLEEELQKKNTELENLQADISRYGVEGKELQEKIDIQENALAERKHVIEQQTEQIKRKQDQIIALAERKILPKYVWQNYAVPLLLSFLTVFFLVFVLLQFFWDNKEWNFAVLFYNWIKTTFFGKAVGDFVYLIDAVFGGTLWYILKKWMKNPFDRNSMESSKLNLIQNYIKKNNLD